MKISKPQLNQLEQCIYKCIFANGSMSDDSIIKYIILNTPHIYSWQEFVQNIMALRKKNLIARRMHKTSDGVKHVHYNLIGQLEYTIYISFRKNVDVWKRISVLQACTIFQWVTDTWHTKEYTGRVTLRIPADCKWIVYSTEQAIERFNFVKKAIRNPKLTRHIPKGEDEGHLIAPFLA